MRECLKDFSHMHRLLPVGNDIKFKEAGMAAKFWTAGMAACNLAMWLGCGSQG